MEKTVKEMNQGSSIAVAFLVCTVIGGSASAAPVYALTSEGVAVINADAAHLAGYTGKGIKVAVIDTGFDIYNPEISANIAGYKSFDYVHDIRGFNSMHGTGVAEIIVDVAPDVELYLYNVYTDIELLNLIDHIIDRGDIDIVSMSMSWKNIVGPADGTSIIAQKVNEARDNGIFWVNAAGNSAEGHWQGRFSDPNDNGWHNFHGTYETISIDVYAGDRLDVVLSWWDSPYQDYDLCLYGGDFFGNLYKIDCSTRYQDWFLGADPYEYITYEVPYDRTVYIGIDGRNASEAVNFQLFSSHDLNQYAVPDSSIGIPADARGSFSVGAVYWSDDTLEDYSSQGPTIDGRIKPDIVGPTGVTTTTYGTGEFYGTSAAAPHVAGAAALAMERHPDAEAYEVQLMLESNTAYHHPKSNLDGTGRVDVEFLSDTTVDPPPQPPAGLEERVAQLEQEVALLEQAMSYLATAMDDILARLAALEAGTTPADNSSTVIEMAPGSGGSIECAVTNECFIPGEVSITVGSKVVWVNSDDMLHFVTAGDLEVDPNAVGVDYPNGFYSGLVNVGEEFSHTFEAAGTYPYFCTVHPWRTGIVHVTDDSDPEPPVPEPEPDENLTLTMDSDGHDGLRDGEVAPGETINVSIRTGGPVQPDATYLAVSYIDALGTWHNGGTASCFLEDGSLTCHSADGVFLIELDGKNTASGNIQIEAYIYVPLDVASGKIYVDSSSWAGGIVLDSVRSETVTIRG